MLILIISGCNTNIPIKTTTINNNKNMKFEYLYRGFKDIPDKSTGSFPKGTLVFTCQTEFNKFINNYLPNLPCNTTIEFSNFFVIYNSNVIKRNNYTVLKEIKNIYTLDNNLDVKYDERTNNEIYAENMNGGTQYSITLLIT